ncbi:glycoside hydrolase N-terminal domain-containing protein [Ruania alkalisoli]|uniref:glycoside hydrolase N-terminal domain-containing protein n=1 Tax=Ruania alkalisoli TaxID=2779775 RepID=UPI001B356C25|nr:glycoside hydrolase N-terminal domain-containing protein [Ruania alkalisoli]
MTDPRVHQLSFTSAASEWVEALPLGSGRLGAMVFGGAVQELRSDHHTAQKVIVRYRSISQEIELHPGQPVHLTAEETRS